MPIAARTRSPGRVQAVPISAAASATLRSDLSETSRVGCGLSSAADEEGSRNRPCLIALRSVSRWTPNSTATSLTGTAAIQQLLGSSRDLVGQDRPATPYAWPIEGRNPLIPILLDAAFNTVGRNSERAHDVRLLTCSLADQLGREHAKRSGIRFGMTKDRIDAIEVRPLPVFPDHADPVIHGSGTSGNER